MSDYVKKVYVIGGGTFSHVRTHLSLAAPSFGGTARRMASLFRETLGFPGDPGYMEVHTIFTKMADPKSDIVTNQDLADTLDRLVADPMTQIIVLNAAVCDFDGTVDFDGPRLSSSREYNLRLTPAMKVVDRIRKTRKDVLLVAFKTTDDASPDEQYRKGLTLLKRASANLVLANDVTTNLNMVITPEEARYHETTDRMEALRGLVEMALLRSHLKFTRSTVVSADSVPWNDPRVFPNLREVVNHCVSQNAYKPFRGSTVGHFAVKVSDTEFLTSRRRTNFNDLEKVGLVRVTTDGPDNVTAYGSRPSVGGQSQRIVFREHDGMDCIVHFHCPMKADAPDAIPVRSQREFECGSHECGQNTSNGLASFGNLKAVMLDNHGPNIVFSRHADPAEVIAFIDRNFDLADKTGGIITEEA